MKKYASFNKMLTPMAKYYASEMSMRASNSAVAVLGGSGYMKDYPVERYLRDARITTIYEGTSQLQIVAAIAGVMGGTVKEVVADIVEGIELDEAAKAAFAQVGQLLGELDAAVAIVREHPDGKMYQDLHARKLVDAAIAVVMGALFVRLSVKIPAKAAALKHHLAYVFPAARCELKKATCGYCASFSDFEALAPAVPEED
jgi:hypothetical protein